MMKFKEVDIPVYRSDYDDLFEAVISAWRSGRAIKVISDKHPQSIRTALKTRLMSDDDYRDLFITVRVDDDGCTVYIEKELSSPEGR
jgi:hypothetical protein